MDYLPDPGSRLIVIAFEGWNDAAESASRFTKDLVAQMGLTRTGMIGGEEFYDFQTARPNVVRGDDGTARIDWPGTEIHTGSVPGTGTLLEVIVGDEPAFLWQRFASLIVDRVEDGDAVVLMGALLADTVHSRPIPVTVTTDRPEDIPAADAIRSEYEGPTGIIGVLAHELSASGHPAVSMWAAVPGYVAGVPSPKAQLALQGAFEELTGLVLDQGDLVDGTRDWEMEAEAAVAADDDLAAYIHRLESMTDAADLPEASGDAIAREFERYLDRRGDD
ncbi:PAC2 family protein [Brevibacterium jeotgali]|uniref:PAC2 family protein n=1 Tax=Brevibacterium jeotgali TaxID=1262550 RepID=A0A2H1L1S5_9MICO|nr:PAC2 family protein [Brevibacterium jeotgali]TWC02844.1 PAC2 family protein [Brevibacterium jeotgali]SMY10866.1 PAC2 family protein [Brevibacterium jeotgali]